MVPPNNNQRKGIMKFVFFLYGLAFFVLGITIFVYPKKDSDFKLAKRLWMLGVFGVLHGINEWVDMFILDTPGHQTYLLEIVRFFLLPVSFLFLVIYGARCLKGLLKNTIIVPVILLFAWSIAVYASNNRMLYGDIYSRYLLCFPGSLLTVFVLASRIPDAGGTWQNRAGTALGVAVVFFAFYGIMSGLFVPKNSFFPGSYINYDTFYNFLGFPIQAVRLLLAAGITISLMEALKVFDHEKKEKLTSAVLSLERSEAALIVRTQELEKTDDELGKTNTKLKATTGELKKEHTFDRLVAQNLKEAIMILDKNYKIIWVNKSAERVTEREQYELLGSYCYKATHNLDEPCEGPLGICPIKEVLKKGRPITVMHTHFTKENEKVYAEVSIYPIRNEKDEIVQFIHVVRDLTGKRALEEELSKKMESIERFNNLAVGRELKMKELKEKIMELKRKLDKNSTDF